MKIIYPRGAQRRIGRLSALALFSLSPFAFAVESPITDTANEPVVRMEPVDVMADPFRILGVHGMAAGSLTSLFGAHNIRVKTQSVNPGSPAAKAGLCAGDEVLAIQGKAIGAYSIYSFHKVFGAAIRDAVQNGGSFECVVRAAPHAPPRTLALRAMVEPKHRWLPIPAFGVWPVASSREPPPGVPVGGLAVSDCHYAGRATPETALQTLIWLRARHDVGGLATMMASFEKGQRSITAVFGTLPEAGRQYYGTPERMLATFVSNEDTPRWLQIRDVSDEDGQMVTLKVALQFWDDHEHRLMVEQFQFRREVDRWTWVPASTTINPYADYYDAVPYELAPSDAAPAIAWFFHSS